MRLKPWSKHTKAFLFYILLADPNEDINEDERRRVMSFEMAAAVFGILFVIVIALIKIYRAFT